MLKLVLLAASAPLVFAQQYTISTIAGGAPPATPASATGTAIGKPRRVTLDRFGNLYFSGANSVFRMNSGGQLTLVAGNSRAGFSGDGGPAVNAQLNGPQGVAVDSAGNIYIADTNNNRVRKVTPDGMISTFAGTGQVSQGGPGTYGDGGNATDALMRLPQGVAVDSSGVVYIADTGNNAVRKVTGDGIINLVAGDSYPSFYGDTAIATQAELHSPSDVLVDSSGNVYIADTSNARVRKVTADGNINTFAGSGAIGFSGDAAAATAAAMRAPVSVALDSSGNLYIADSVDCRIRKVDSKGIITTVAGTGAAGFGGDGGAATAALMDTPTGITLDSSGNLYIADSQNLRVRKISGTNISTVAGSGVLSFSGDNGPALSAQMNFPAATAVDGSGNVYVADSANHVVRRVAKDGTITRVAGTGTAGFGGDGAAGTSAQLNSPQGLAVDGSGNLYISDTQNARVRKVTAGGTISTVAGNGTPGFGGDGGGGGSAQVNNPIGLAADRAGNLYIADFNNSRIRKVDTGGTITTVAGNGASGYAGDGGAATSAMLNLPQGVGVDQSGNVFIADTANNRIRVVRGSLISTFAGNGLPGFSGDSGQATSAQFGHPTGIAVDPAGSVYASDGSARVRKIFAAGLIGTVAGTGVAGYSGDGGVATAAQLDTPAGLAADTTGNVYIADAGNNAVRVLQPTGGGISLRTVGNAASNQGTFVAPGEILTLFGTGMGPDTPVQGAPGADGLLPAGLAGTTVLINGVAAPLLYTSATQVSTILPFDLSGSAQVTVGYGGQFSSVIAMPVQATAPAIFTQNGSGTGQAVAFNDDHTMNDAAHPAKGGSVVDLYITGAGQTNPAGQYGASVTGAQALPVAMVTGNIGGKTATQVFAGSVNGMLQGLMLVRLQVPAGLTAGAVPVTIQAGNNSTQTGVTIYVSGD